MSTTQRVSPRELERVRRRVATIGQDPSPEEGWNIDTSVAESIVGMFSRLSVREGLRLVTIAARGGIGGTIGPTPSRRNRLFRRRSSSK